MQFTSNITSKVLSKESNTIRIHKKKELDHYVQQLESIKSTSISSSSDPLEKKILSDRAKLIQQSLSKLELQVKQDNEELESALNESSYFLSTAIWYYARCLFVGNSHDKFAIMALVSLWLSNSNNDKAMATLKKVGIYRIGSYKWIPLAYQLCARLNDDGIGNESTNFQPLLRGIITRMAVKHPYHTLPILFSLKNANNNIGSIGSDSQIAEKTRTRTDSLKLDESRNKISSQIIDKASESNDKLKSIVSSFDFLFDAYIQLANTPESDSIRRDSAAINGKKLVFFNRNMLVLKLPELSHVPILTAHIKIDSLGSYSDLVSDQHKASLNEVCHNGPIFMTSIEKGYKLAGGINLPKIIKVSGSDGRVYTQLVKGKDDLRQDYVIEQLFKLINDIFKSSDNSSIRDLGLVTYNVIPLSKRSGIVEWVENTTPLGTWLSEAYKNLPKKIDLVSYRKEFHSEQIKKSSTIETKLNEFNRIMEKIPPIFRIFFLNLSSDILKYFYNQRRYTISLSTASIICWLLGIGDRHSQNILISNKSCEIVHIDLGIAFNMGSLLPIPELVPFRLTQNILDGMGLLNNENNGNSIFFKFCSETLTTVRKHHDLINTVLGVLKHDPLYQWSGVSDKKRQITNKQLMRNDVLYSKPQLDGFSSLNPFQKLIKNRTKKINDGKIQVLYEEDNNDYDESNREAERAIYSVSKRLSSELSVDCVVNELIQDATDPNNLSRMFSGWQPWL
ncbi:Serine-protein kinase ATM [Smittium mucronatum]|uniref:Serine/threonine-protein kinase TEL1 n=1 Tax=Smittium mucronatum TaxID=133383 RepID=A0A1R0GYR9_9FUNG|nr:Serine-protein kinase ATM [Smittium mucronatum]